MPGALAQEQQRPVEQKLLQHYVRLAEHVAPPEVRADRVLGNAAGCVAEDQLSGPADKPADLGYTEGRQAARFHMGVDLSTGSYQ